eukprot:s4037_g2.t1
MVARLVVARPAVRLARPSSYQKELERAAEAGDGRRTARALRCLMQGSDDASARSIDGALRWALKAFARGGDLPAAERCFFAALRRGHRMNLEQLQCLVEASLVSGGYAAACRWRLCAPIRLGMPAPRSAVGEIEWRRREKDEHELGFSLRLNKVEYYKEVGTLHYILSHGQHLNIPAIHRGIESFTREQELWLKLAGDEKGAVLDKVLALQGKARLVVEVGLYVGYSSTRMASQMRHWGGRVISMEVDPYHAAIARNTIEWAGLTDHIEIWCGHSENLIPRLKDRLPEKSIDILFFDQQGTKMHLDPSSGFGLKAVQPSPTPEDLQRIVDFNMLSDRAIVVGDNVLRPGAPQFMYWNSVAGPYETQVVSLREYKQEVVEEMGTLGAFHVQDWMSISFWLPRSPEAQQPMEIPEVTAFGAGDVRDEAVEQLAHDTDGIRWQSVESKVSEQQWESHSQRMRREFAACGITPQEVVPYQDSQGRSQVELRQKQSPY